MVHSPEFTKTRTAALPNVSKGLAQARQIQAKINGRTSTLGSTWAPPVFGPYLVPLTRRVE
jgi:hypothetical protein